MATLAQDARPQNVPDELVYDIDMYALAGIEEGFQEAWSRACPPGTPDLIWTPRTGGHWIATNGAVIREMYSDPARFSSEVIFMPKEAGEAYAMVPTRMDPPEHTPYRVAITKGLGTQQVKAVEEKVRSIAAELIDQFAAKGHCDFAAEYADIFPDLPMSDVPALSKFAAAMTRPEGATPQEQAANLDAANKGFFDYCRPIIEERRGSDRTDMITMTINTKVEGRPLSEENELGLVALLLLAGLDTVVNFLNFFMIYLARHPETVAELNERPEALRRNAEEMFRRFPVVSEARMASHDFEYRGVQFKHGDMILMPTSLHGLDPSVNQNPWKLDLMRTGGGHSTFGGGPHRCAGIHLAKLEVMVTVEEWLKRIPSFKLTEGMNPLYFSGIVAAVQNVQLEWDT